MPGDAAAAMPGVNPADKDPAKDPKAPAAVDPVEQAGKMIDVVGKGIDLVGKVPENLDKWVTLAQHLKDLGNASTATQNPQSLIPNLTPNHSNLPSLAGDVSIAPTLDPSNLNNLSNLPVSHSGTSGSTSLPSMGLPPVGHSGIGTQERGTPTTSSRAATTSGGVGAEPALTGKTATSSTTTGSQTPPMYPPMNGAGAGGAGARAEVRSGAAPGRPGFSVPTESTASERLRRQGVQVGLQGRSNGEQRTPSGAPPLAKRRTTRPSRVTSDDVLDDEMWKA